jgi:hypothetical protein
MKSCVQFVERGVLAPVFFLPRLLLSTVRENNLHSLLSTVRENNLHSLLLTVRENNLHSCSVSTKKLDIFVNELLVFLCCRFPNSKHVKNTVKAFCQDKNGQI